MEGDTRSKISSGVSGPSIRADFGMGVDIGTGVDVGDATGNGASDVAMSVAVPPPQANPMAARRVIRPPRTVRFTVREPRSNRRC